MLAIIQAAAAVHVQTRAIPCVLDVLFCSWQWHSMVVLINAMTQCWQGIRATGKRFDHEREVAEHVVEAYRLAGGTAQDVPAEEGCFPKQIRCSGATLWVTVASVI